MSEILHKSKTNIGEWGNSLGVRIKKFYLKLAGMDEKNTEVIQAVIKGEHGIFIGHWLPDDQPNEITEADLQKLKSMEEKLKEKSDTE